MAEFSSFENAILYNMRLAILSDIHEDLVSLQKVLRKIDQKGCDKIICLGDISGFSASYYRYGNKRDAPACLDLVRERCEIIIPGNHDLYAAGKFPALPAGTNAAFWPHEEDLDPGYSQEQIAFLASLPAYRVLPGPGYGILLSHYISPNLSGFNKGFYTRANEFGPHFLRMQKANCAVGFTGHSHAWGFYTVTPTRFKQYGYRSIQLEDFPEIVGIPPVTRHKNRSGFCIFDTDSSLLQVIKK
jgi:predicted phosphodiesterase